MGFTAKIRQAFRRNVWMLAALVAVLLFAISFLQGRGGDDADHSAKHVSGYVSERMAALDDFAESLLAFPRNKWAELRGVPDDMVLYRYVDDTLNCWFNLFGVMNDDISLLAQYPCMADLRSSCTFPLANAGYDPSYVNIGRRWYILKKYSREDVTVIAGLLVKDDALEDKVSGGVGLNPHLHVHGNNVVTSLMNDGSTVYLKNVPIFKITSLKSPGGDDQRQRASLFRLLAALFCACALVLWSFGKRSARRCIITLVLLSVLAIIFRMSEQNVSRDIFIFSPSLYANDGLLDSFGTLLFINGVIFLATLSIYSCRREMAEKLSQSKHIGRTALIAGIALIPLFIYYVRQSLTGLMMNSDIALEPRKLPMMDWNTIFAYFSYLLLILGIFLLIEFFLCLFNDLYGKNLSLRRKYAISVFVVLGAGFLSWTIMSCSMIKEQSRISNYSNRLAMDRDLMAEVTFLGAEKEIATDPVIMACCALDDSRRVIAKRLEELYLHRIYGEYDISVKMLNMDTPADILLSVDSRAKKATTIAEHSRFKYEFDPSTGGRYFAVFTFESEGHALCGFLLELTPKNSSSLLIRPNPRGRAANALPPFYAYARYFDGKLVTFKGNFAYPMLIPVHWTKISDTMTHGGYKHFINVINDEEVIVVSREDTTLLSDFVMFLFIVIALFLMVFIFFRTRSPRHSGTRRFSSRMKRLTFIPLFSTLIVMALVSVLFVGTMSERDRKNLMSSKISSVQLMLDSYCREIQTTEDLMNSSFAENLFQTSKTAGSDILLYSPSGKLIMTSSPDMAGIREESGRIQPEAYRQIVLNHERFCILKLKLVPGRISALYAPVMNGSGKMLAIACAPYMDSNKYFTRDAFFHAGIMFCVFMLILFIVTFVLSSITNSIFQPLETMGQKMKAADPNALEPIEYKGNDEIAALVQSYNDMVMTMRSSTVRLAEAERNRAWSEMARQVAHEIKNPLTPIKLELQRILRLKAKGDPNWEEKFEKASEVVLEHIDILSETANEFSTFAKLYSETPVEFNLDKTIQDQIVLFSDKNVEITYLGMEEAMFTGPKPQLIRVIFNILSNAVQAVEGIEKPSVLMSLRKGEAVNGAEGWTICIEDNGPGVSDENMEKLFTPNFTTKSGGTGLGLAISRNVVENCGGSISYRRSFTLGGACFVISLPLGAKNVT